MRRRPLPPLFLCVLLLLPFRDDAARAAEASETTEGAGITLHVAPAEDGTLRAALRVELQPGWKTYWLDPGQSGIPPTLRVAAPYELRTMRLPAPHRFGEGFERANGFTGAPAFALVLDAPDGAREAPVEVTATLGLCRDICVPVNAVLRARPSEASAAAVSAAFAALPERDERGRRILEARLDASGRTLAVSLSGDASGELFVAGEKGWYFGEAGTPTVREGVATYAVPVTGRPRGHPAPPEVTIVRAEGEKAWERRLVAVDSAR